MADGHWTPIMVEERIEEAANVLRRLPAVKVQGYYSLWPRYMYEFADLVGQEPAEIRLPPPSAAAITRMDEAMEWLRWLEPDDARLVWMRAEGRRWKAICVRLGISRNTAHRHWQYAMLLITWRLNGRPAPVKQSRHAFHKRAEHLAKMEDLY